MQVNESFAINLVDEEPPTEVKGRAVWCDGGKHMYSTGYLEINSGIYL